MDSLIVMDFVASVEDEFDILITMNMPAEIETVGHSSTPSRISGTRDDRSRPNTQDPADEPPGHTVGRDLFSKFDALIAEREALLDTGFATLRPVMEE